MSESAKGPAACALVALAILAGCLTPEMGRDVEDALGLNPRLGRPHPRAPATPFDTDAALPARIWYADLVAQVYHERRTNTFIAWDPVHKGWAAVPQEDALARGFNAERSHLLAQGAPVEVSRVLDYLLAMEPGWRGS